jgi:hypothetical protein
MQLFRDAAFSHGNAYWQTGAAATAKSDVCRHCNKVGGKSDFHRTDILKVAGFYFKKVDTHVVVTAFTATPRTVARCA